jgi:hypothetical protein
MAQLRGRGPRILALPFLATVLLTACSSAPTGAPGAGSPAPADSVAGVDLGASTAILKAAKLGEPESLGALEGIRFTATGTQAAAALLAGGASGDELWAATYVYASSATDPAPLLSVAGSATASASVRAMASAALLSLGKAEGFAPLVAVLGAAGPMEGAEPPEGAWEFAARTLERYTHAGFAEPATNDEAARTATATQWSGWLATNSGHLRFDSGTKLWMPA